ncbi:cellulose synthase/poly-beta-1,6-N-acetylglucosamine synthase-like glycosyltransferase [Microbacteriaceae bacterium SG_E_30_P1]|uniref:Cellulose synthase/poly-beta-1,6-N-acetylglucosamine synthase-like glycosyltransferase n=1 Tax=Antiquaquibacter oligotrophicus TaxID=2880260 RepID=A0ABT6KPM6_9MICO|nr:glycosyltransferase [Antiquaquibacter oligotrophicus]MDH6181940.1 cellulose synthase/poly-beta-1,6-N-acetylglucosamine synthase-like glycosyltransferase [Antiquaquibacter oligotrophicus]UDF12390.1 glycosyltransferase family 2 protein [Antiquaquibacter oligotrophicus]
MTDEWLGIGASVLEWFLVALVATGAVPIVTTLVLFIAIPFHAVRNHYRKAAPYLPRVAVVIPAWNEGAVIGATIDRLLAIDYPEWALRIYVVDDASTDQTPDVVLDRAARYPGRVFHLRRENGGQGKAHTINHGLRIILGDDWMQALLITDADVIFLPDSLRKMTRHLADPEIGAVSAYIREGSPHKNYLMRFIGIEYVLAQAAARRAQNVFGAQACLAGGAQLHSRTNLEELGGRIDTTSLAEDTVMTFETQLSGRRVVFDPYAIVLAEEPGSVTALWKQRLRWARGNLQVTARYRRVWFHPRRGHDLGTLAFGLAWFSIFLLPAIMVASSVGLLGLLALGSNLAVVAFQGLWGLATATYFYSIVLALQLDRMIARQAWLEAILFPGILSMLVMITAFFPGLFEDLLPAALGVTASEGIVLGWTIFAYSWISISMIFAWLIKLIDGTKAGKVLTPLLTYIIGYGPILCAVTVDSYIKQARRAEARWDKTEKVGRVTA